MPGVTIWSGSRFTRLSTNSSTSAMVMRAAVGHHRIEITRGLPIDQVSQPIATPSFYQREIGSEAPFQDIRATLEFARSFPSATIVPTPAGV